jgi:hypothetical protein
MLDGSLGGPWNYTNAASFIGYTVNKGYDIHGWELGMFCVILCVVWFCHKRASRYLPMIRFETTFEKKRYGFEATLFRQF